MQDIDPAIQDLILEINKHKYFKTILSCAGHYNVCNDFKKKLHFDDNEIDYYLDFLVDNQKYCYGTTQPYISFYVKKNSQTILFLEALKKSQVSFPFSFYEDNEYISYGYSNGDEGYYVANDPFSVIPQFKNFWENFLKKWKTYINPDSKLESIQVFSLNPSKNINCICNESINDQQERKFSYFEMELFEDDYIDLLCKINN